MDKFNEYLDNKIKSEKEEFRLPKSFERKLEETLENLSEDNKIINKKWSYNKGIFTTAACFIFVFLVGISIKYPTKLDGKNIIEKSAQNEDSGYSGNQGRIINDSKSIEKETLDISLQENEINEIIDYSKINKKIIKYISNTNTYKLVDNKNDIENIIKFINDIPKEKIEKQNINNWDFLIQTNGTDNNHSIVIENNIINIDEQWYKIDSYKVDNLISIYNNLSYEENDIPYCDY